MKSNVVILGAGLSGLGCARALPGAKVFEAGAHPGGHAYSHELGGVHFDEGAHICHAKDQSWLDLLYRQAGPVECIEKSRVRNFWRGHWTTYPVQNHLNELPVETRTKALTDLVAAQVEFKGHEPKNYHEWLLGQYGRFLTDNFYSEYTAKYWRVPMAELGLDWLGGRLLPAQVERIVAGALAKQDEKQSTFAKFHYPARGGFFAFFAPLYRELNIAFGHRATRVDAARRQVTFENGRTENYDALASSIPLPELVKIIADAPDAVRAAAARLRHVQLLCVNMLINRPSLSSDHWFYIYDPDIDIARVSVASNLAPASAPPGVTALQAEIFRRHDEPMDEAALAAKAVRDLGRVLNFAADDVRMVKPVRVPYSYVISDLHRASSVDVIAKWLDQHRIFPMGLFGAWKYVWSDVAFRSGEATASRIAG